MPESIQFDGLLPRPVYLRRGKYYEALRDIWNQTGTGPESTLVAGDIYELDLALPIELGLQVHLVTGPTTASYERAALAALGPRVSSGDRVSDVLARLQSA